MCPGPPTQALQGFDDNDGEASTREAPRRANTGGACANDCYVCL
jgi:hypothetical protein